MRGVVTLGKSVKQLKLPDGFGDALPVKEGEGEPNDKVKATGLMEDLHVLPGVWSPIKGYDGIAQFFVGTFGASRPEKGMPGNLVEVPYDWRLSNVVSARRLRDKVMPALVQWRENGHPDAKLVLVCHSMGGLVARWFLEKLEGYKDTRWLITLGTPYQGSMIAVDALVNGLSKALGPLQVDLTKLVQSFPSMYELLPTYPCFTGSKKELKLIAEAPGLGLRTKMLESAAAFHAELAAAIASRPDRGYRTVAIKGVLQPTMLSARPGKHGVELIEEYRGRVRGGDGTVPRPSSHPPEWGTEGTGDTIGASQRHAALQDSQDVFVQLFTRLTSDAFGTWMGGQDIGVEVGATAAGSEFEATNLIQIGQPIVVRTRSDDNTLALRVTLIPHESETPATEPLLMTNHGGGRYEAIVPPVSAGTYRVTVSTAPTAAAEPVSDFIVVWDAYDEL